MPTRKPPKSKSVQPTPKRPAHRPAYVPTEQGRAQVAAMTIASIDQHMIAHALRISRGTLRKHYRRELDVSYAIILAEIAGKCVTLARGGSEKMIQFYLECHGWVRSERLVVADGGIDDTDIASLSDAQIAARIAKLQGKRRR